MQRESGSGGSGSAFDSWENSETSAAEKRGLWEGVVQEPLRRALFCVFLCSEVIFSCKSHRNFSQKLPLQCRHFLENPLAKNPKTQLLKTGRIRFRRVRFQIPNSVSFLALAEFRGENSVSSSQPIICVHKISALLRKRPVSAKGRFRPY